MSSKSSQPVVVIFGTSITSAYLSGGTMLFRALAQAFICRDWAVVFVEENHSWLGAHTDFAAKNSQLTILRYDGRGELSSLAAHHRLLETARLVLKFSGSSGPHDRYIDEWLASERAREGLEFILIYVDADAPMRLPYIINHSQFYLHRIITAFDGVWVMLGGERAAREYMGMKAQRVWYTSVGIDVEAFQPTAPVAEYSADLLFVGNPTYGREAALNRLFFEVARRCPNYRFLLAGADWDETNLPANLRYLSYVPSDRLAELYCSARLVLNVTREEMAAYGYAAALRLFEAAACSACIVSDSWVGLDQLFVPDEEILVANDTEDVIGYLSNVGEVPARLIGQRAMDRVRRDHTAGSRVDFLLTALDMS